MTSWHAWQGDHVVAHGRIFTDNCGRCGWPKADHPRDDSNDPPGEHPGEEADHA